MERVEVDLLNNVAVELEFRKDMWRKAMVLSEKWRKEAIENDTAAKQLQGRPDCFEKAKDPKYRKAYEEAVARIKKGLNLDDLLKMWKEIS